VDGAIVVNIADCLQRWSNDVLRSTRHRVTTDPRLLNHDDLPARHSIAFFCNPNKETLVQALPGTGAEKHAPINAFDYLVGRLNNTIVK
jgi:isopenicillin N synthase-like dioxygenase